MTTSTLVRYPLKARAITTYVGVHAALRRLYGKAHTHSCASCSEPAHEWAYDHTDDHPLISLNSHGYRRPYSLDLRKCRPMCKRCHRLADKGRPDIVTRRIERKVDPAPTVDAWW